MFRYITITITLLLLASCEKQTDWELQPGDNNLVVVDGIITDELIYQSIKLSRSVDNPNDNPEPVTGAEVIVSVSGNVYHFEEQSGTSGTYISDDEFAGKPGKEHSLLITSGNTVYSAKAGMMQAGGNFEPVTFLKNKENGLFQIFLVSNPYNPRHAAIYELLLDWSGVAGYEDADSAETHSRLLYYTLPTLDVSEVLSPAMEAIYFPAGTMVVERRYSLSTEHAAFIRALLSETNWQGGYFSSASANVPSNLSNGAVGFFGACSITTRTDIVKDIFPSSGAGPKKQ
jgi:hypothetical protein